MTSCNLRAQVALALLRGADVVQQQCQDVALDFAGAHDLNRRDAQPFLIDLAAESHGTGVCTAHVSVVGARSHIKVRRLGFAPANPVVPHVDRRYEGDVG